MIISTAEVFDCMYKCHKDHDDEFFLSEYDNNPKMRLVVDNEWAFDGFLGHNVHEANESRSRSGVFKLFSFFLSALLCLNIFLSCNYQMCTTTNLVVNVVALVFSAILWTGFYMKSYDHLCACAFVTLTRNAVNDRQKALDNG